ncbi:MAG: hypothetical protein K0U37_04315 [Gammaproteobacteria bacterium]|nr:hypothetical protein [Gammaproteobacteria bacterium]
MPKIIYSATSKITLTSYNQECKDNGTENAVFIFPGNSSHHRNTGAITDKIYAKKGGGGLASVAASLGKANHPTLSLPTTSMEEWSTNKAQQATVHQAVADLYAAVGLGYDLMLPVRKHHSDHYFSAPLSGTENKEPSFWGGIQKAVNLALADEYTQQLDRLSLFLSEIESLGEEQAINHLTQYDATLSEAYNTGKMSGNTQVPPAITPRSSTAPKSTDKAPSKNTTISDTNDIDWSFIGQCLSAVTMLVGGALLVAAWFVSIPALTGAITLAIGTSGLGVSTFFKDNPTEETDVTNPKLTK